MLDMVENLVEMLEHNTKCLLERLDELEKKLADRDSNAKNLAIAVADRLAEKNNEVPSL